MTYNLIWILFPLLTQSIIEKSVLFFEKSHEKLPYTTILGTSVTIRWNFTIDIKSYVSFFEVYLSKDNKNVLISNMIVGDDINITPEINSYIDNISYNSIHLKQVPLSFDHSSIYIKVHFNDINNSKHYQTDYYSSKFSIVVEPYGKCEHLSPKLLYSMNQIKCIIISKPAANMRVLFDEAPTKYNLNQIKQDTAFNYTNETIFIVSFLSNLKHQDSSVRFFFTNNEKLWLKINVTLYFKETPNFDCNNPTEYDGKISVICHCSNSLNNVYNMKFKINNIDENSSELKNYWNIQRQQLAINEEKTTFTIDKGWLLQTPSITIEVESTRIKISKTLNIIFSKKSLPMGVNFYFLDRINGQKSDFTCKNIENGLIPICQSVSDKNGKFIYQIYNPHSMLHPQNEPIFINIMENWKFGLWSCKVSNSNGMVVVNTMLTINDIPCHTQLTVQGIDEYIDPVSIDIYRVHKKDFKLRCDYIGYPEPLHFYFEDATNPYKGFNSISKETDIRDSLVNNHIYWSCTVYNKNGSRKSITTAIVYEAYNTYKPRLWMVLASIAPLVISLLLMIFLIAYIVICEQRFKLVNNYSI